MELNQIFDYYGSDKNKNGYTPVYHSLFKNIRNKELDFLGGSPDGIAESIDNPEIEPILIEVKCPYRRKIIDEYKKQINILNDFIKLEDQSLKRLEKNDD